MFNINNMRTIDRSNSRLVNGRIFELPLDDPQRDAFCRELGSFYSTVGEATFISPDSVVADQHLEIRNVGVLWLSEFIINRSMNDIDDSYTTDDLLQFGYPLHEGMDIYSPIQKKIRFFIDSGLVTPEGGRRYRRYTINPGFSGLLKYVKSGRNRRKPAIAYDIDLI